MVIFESTLASRSFKLKPELGILSSLARYIPILLGIYLAVKLVDLTLRDAWPYVLENSFRSFMYIVELTAGVIIPLILFSNRKIRHSASGLLTASALVIFGVVLNRINVFIVAYKPLYATSPYYPSLFEIAVTLGLAAALILVYRFIVMNFPVIAAPVAEKKKDILPISKPSYALKDGGSYEKI
jgi:Ni/Fe-hydrogenase subunit HybB-like protein